jgi:hypothetical protein
MHRAEIPFGIPERKKESVTGFPPWLGTTLRPLGNGPALRHTARKVEIFDDCRVDTSPEKLPSQVGIVCHWL